jgi:hypothetical protein
LKNISLSHYLEGDRRGKKTHVMARSRGKPLLETELPVHITAELLLNVDLLPFTDDLNT